MDVLGTRLDPRSDDYRSNRAEMQGLLDEVVAAMRTVPGIGGEKYVQRHHDRGKLLVRERIELLIDRDSPFLELSPLAAWGTGDPVGAGSTVGIGLVEGVECVIHGSDMTVRGGSSNPSTLKKGQRAHEIARVNRLPYIDLTESAGADLPRQAESWVRCLKPAPPGTKISAWRGRSAPADSVRSM